MNKSTLELAAALDALRRRARALNLTDSGWAALAGLRKETLSRLRDRPSCDFATLQALARVVGMRVGVLPHRATSAQDAEAGHFPASVDRNYEAQLVALCASPDLDPARWADAGPRFFMAGLAVMVASVTGFDRRGLLALAEQLHPGASETEVFNQWLMNSPVRPSRFLPLLGMKTRHAA